MHRTRKSPYRHLMRLLALAGLALTAASGTAQVIAAATQPLFEDNGPFKLVIEAPFGHLVGDRVGKSTYRDGTLRYVDDAGHERVMPLEIRTRGKTRLRKDVCAFPPLRLRFAESDVFDTLFEGQRAIKLVTHCRDSDGYDQLVLQEYLAYRVYNVLTDYSHRVRLADITYRQANGAHLASRLGIFLERWKSVADRNHMIAAIVDGGVNIEMLSRDDANRVAVFQYLIGNEDWSVLWPESNEDCCHNTKPLYADGLVIPLPYDFDFAGIVNAPYAIPKPPNRKVRNRRYGGLCHTQSSSLEGTLSLFRERRDAIYALYREQTGLRERVRTQTLRYLDRFYEVINDPAKVERQLIRRCKEK